MKKKFWSLLALSIWLSLGTALTPSASAAPNVAKTASSVSSEPAPPATEPAVANIEQAVTETEPAVTELKSAVTETKIADTEVQSAVTESKPAVTKVKSTDLELLKQPRRSASQRKVVFESTRNTRDLGGMPTRCGYVKNGILYRSGALCYATPNDQKTIDSLRLKTIIDLRTTREIQKKGGPDRLSPQAQIVQLHYPMSNKSDKNSDAYFSYAIDNDESVQGFFHALAQPQSYPLLFHCSAGKDRTGVLTALVLELLGTDRRIIMDDYLESKRNSEKLKVHRHWLRKVFRLIDEAGGVVPFLCAQGVSPADLRAIPALIEDK